METLKRLTIVLLILACARPAVANERVLDARLHHLRTGGEREWTEFPEHPEAERLRLVFEAQENTAERTLRLRQQDVKQAWKVELNGEKLGELVRDENDMVVFFDIPPGVLSAGDNVLRIEQNGETPDDIRVGDLRLIDRPRGEVLSEADVSLRVIDRDYGHPLPCRVTVLDENGSLVTVGAVSNERMAIRPGIVYSGDGRPLFGLPAGRYTIYAGRGFEYGIDSLRVSLASGDSLTARLAIAREVSTPGYVSCDTHIHTFTHSRHGDATIEERMLTIAGEGIELPIATDHNLHVDYAETASRLGVRQYFTPVIGNEVTTEIGHFNIFPVEAGAPVPDHTSDDWTAIFEGIYATPGVRVVILNHARDIHSGYRPLGPLHHNAATARNLDGWNLRANAIELVNSAAQQNDVMRLVRDWMTFLNRGKMLTPVGSSDSHDVGRHFVGQGRTYIRAGDRDPGAIDVGEAARSLLRGRTLVSCGLLSDIAVDGTWRPGDLVPAPDGEIEVTVRVLGPSWSTAGVVELYANGHKVREATITGGKRPGVKWSGTWKLSDLRHDVHLVAVARGPAVRELYWPIAKPYQATSPEWSPQVIGISGAVWIDADGDGKRTSAFDYAKRLVAASGGSLAKLLTALSTYDAAVAAQVAGILQEEGTTLSAIESAASAGGVASATRQGFRQLVSASRASEDARRETSASRPNVLFITIDDLRNETGCYGKPQVITPNIDRLAERGMRFDRAYVQATFCNPSRVSFLTGLRPDRTGILDNRTWFRDRLPDVVTLPQLFRESGYTTVRLGKIFHAGERMDDPKAWDIAKYPEATARGREGEGRNLTGGKVRWCRWLAAEGDDEDQPDGQIAREAVRFLGRQHDKPFFLAAGFHKPHDPFVAPKTYFEPYPLEKIELYRDPAEWTSDLPFAIGGGWKREFDKFTDRERKEFLRAYYAGTTFVDAQIGRVLAAVERSGLAESTIIVLISDHGYHLGERGWWNKSTLFELSCRTPMIVYAPSMKAKGRSCARLVEFVDLYPTLTELCGLEAPPGLEGRSFVPLLDDPDRDWKDAAYTQIRRGRIMGRSVRTERWRYIEWDGGRAGAELYDHENDPGEYRNVVRNPEHAAVVKRLHKLLAGDG